MLASATLLYLVNPITALKQGGSEPDTPSKCLISDGACEDASVRGGFAPSRKRNESDSIGKFTPDTETLSYTSSTTRASEPCIEQARANASCLWASLI